MRAAKPSREVHGRTQISSASQAQVGRSAWRPRHCTTDPGEAFHMGWGFTKDLNPDDAEFQVACFTMICHNCVQRYEEFFPYARQMSHISLSAHMKPSKMCPCMVIVSGFHSAAIRIQRTVQRLSPPLLQVKSVKSHGRSVWSSIRSICNGQIVSRSTTE